jgi:hypothetical protein
MKSPAISVLPRPHDRHLPTNLPTTPQLRILFQSPDRRLHKKSPWKGVSLLVAAGLLVFGASYITSAPQATKIKISTLPDYARYQWAGYHRTLRNDQDHPVLALRRNWI